ncbi:acid phosphatase 1 [Phtheirospermum japonicum]|uniref:Acid phosphatase 1 n=1 Tax=Phtheirospermum japonicum TaxID=374723 RepID=A0A830BKK7_9LAMI|nr:acid phosphatase 1 [Phtheirospermum japonicum]
MARGIGEALLAVLVLIATCCSSPKAKAFYWTSSCLSWRVGVEANNVRSWRVVPPECVGHVAGYMLGGQYELDLSLVVDNIISYANNITLSGDAKDTWILDVDDTCISNLRYYEQKNYGGKPYDPAGFQRWALMGVSPNIPQVLRLHNKLVKRGFKVILLTGRDEETLRNATSLNLKNQGYFGYDRLVLRTAKYKGQSAITYKSDIRKQLVEEGLRLWGNVGDQWSDLQGDYVGNRTFKLPNPMYFVP